MYRLKIPSTLLNGGVIDFNGKADPEDEAFIAMTRNQQQVVNTKVQATADWDLFLQGIPKQFDKTEIAQFMLEPRIGTILMNNIKVAKDLKAMVIELVSSPEYQLC
jgi:hypothetical protein